LKYLVFKQYSKEDAQKLKPFFDAFCKEILAFPEPNYRDDSYYKKMDALVSKSVEKILNQSSEPGSPYTIGQVTGKLRPNFLENPLWTKANKYNYVPLQPQLVQAPAVPQMVPNQAQPQKVAHQAQPPAKPIANNPVAVARPQQAPKMIDPTLIGAVFYNPADYDLKLQHAQQGCPNCHKLTYHFYGKLFDFYQNRNNLQNFPSVQGNPQVIAIHQGLLKIVEWMNVEEAKNPDVFKNTLKNQLQYSAVSLAHNFVHQQGVKPIAGPAPQPAQNNTLISKQAAEVTKNWRFDPDKLTEITPEQAQRYDEIQAAIQAFPDVTETTKEDALYTIRLFQTFHTCNEAICTEVFTNAEQHSHFIYVKQPRDILLHPEQMDASLEERANIFYNSIDAAWFAVRENPPLFKRFIEEAFYHGAPCLEARNDRITKWLINKDKTIDETIQAEAFALFENIKRNSDKGKRFLNHLQRKEKFTKQLEALDPSKENDKADLKERIDDITLGLPRLEDDFTNWMKASNKYQELKKELSTRLDGKGASNGTITGADIDKVLIDQLGWPVDKA